MRSKNRQFPWLYLVLAYGMSWVLWIPVVLTRQDYQASPALLAIVLLGVFGPGVAGIVLTYVERGREGGRDYWSRAIDPRRIRLLWWVVIALLWPALHGIALLANRLLGGPTPQWGFVRQMAEEGFALPAVVILYLLQALLEELGWRGYMQDRVQALWGPLVSSAVVGLCHAFWHLPSFFMVGTNQIEYGFGVDFWLFVAFVLSTAVFATLCYNANNRSTLAVTLLHTAGNLCLDIFGEPGPLFRTFWVVSIIASLFVVAAWIRARIRTDRSTGPA